MPKKQENDKVTVARENNGGVTTSITEETALPLNPRNGEMRGDFTRNSFDPAKHFSRVLMQQGRVQLDADWNEQADILLHFMRTLATDIIGPYGGPQGCSGFEITKADNGAFKISQGRYYVDGILCENGGEVTHSTQLSENVNHLFYLDVWERHITCIEDEDLREVALVGPDTATRSKVVWQVKVLPDVKATAAEGCENELKDRKGRRSIPLLRAKALIEEPDDLPCTMSPQSRYRGAENQLYRVEIHSAGKAAGNEGNRATFKWSRDNASVAFPIRSIESSDLNHIVLLDHLGRDERFSLSQGDWVEFIDDNIALEQTAHPLLKVLEVDRLDMRVSLEGTLSENASAENHPFLRRWDHKEISASQDHGEMSNDNALKVQEGKYLTLEDGVQIQFSKLGAEYNTGDYWLIPARVATGDVIWPKEEHQSERIPEALSPSGIVHHYVPLAEEHQLEQIPKALPPSGIVHHYAPLAIVVSEEGKLVLKECRRFFAAVAQLR